MNSNTPFLYFIKILQYILYSIDFKDNYTLKFIVNMIFVFIVLAIGIFYMYLKLKMRNQI